MDKKTLTRLTKQHSVLGAISACILTIIFVCGSLLFFRGQLLNWQFAWHQDQHVERDMSWQSAVTDMMAKIPSFAEQRITLTTDPQHHHLFQIYIGHDDRLLYNNQTQQLFGQDSAQQQAAADFLYFWHINFMTHIGTDIIALACIFLIMVTISGIWIRWRDLVKKFHQYRANGKSRDVFKDSHVLLGLGVLLFMLMYGWSSALFNVGYEINAPIYHKYADKSGENYWDELGFPRKPDNYDMDAKLSAERINQVISDYQQAYPDMRIARFDIYPGPWIRLRVSGESDRSFEFVTAFYDVHGNLLYEPYRSPVNDVYNIMIQLHEGHLLGKSSHLLYFILSLMAIAAMLIGNLYWLAIREPKRAGQGLFRLQRACLEAGTCGALLAIALLLVCTRLFSQGEPLTVLANQLIVIVSLLGCGLLTCYFKQAKESAHMVLQIAGVLFLILPCIDVIRLLLGHEIYSFVHKDLLTANIAFIALSGLSFGLATIVVRVTDKVKKRTIDLEPANDRLA
ncbi:PepSY-associated TM helix domain-containing protein [Pseudoalteromonas luteoviolacea]|uniref:PepSY-associated TM helix domain-containing protein n=1 Tax=Pseudoalteromonas luteoviolacea TaxID=43657 RepID=UPI001B3786DD|nr:PepSY-associated TM helix domain-containing protein [Pseudoalteromonas luteoviolacea]MBQ4839273.1 PepSY domain-containing protein [Pseudoalteromonas luteoviolacea]